MSARLGVLSGIGLVVANMVGAGVFLSAGFMAQELRPLEVLLAWVVGAIIALSGATAYAAIARIVPASGGEYRYLSELLHPFLGYAAGWASLLVGFAGPIAIDAYAAGAFVQKLSPSIDPRTFGAFVIVGLVGFHALHLALSKSVQNAMVVLKIGIIVTFVAFGLALGERGLPEWSPTTPSEGFPWQPFAGSLFFIAYAFSGWNAATYASEEFEKPKTQVALATLFGCAGVAVAYLLVNWVLVANVTPDDAKVVFRYESERLTLAHVVAQKVAGPGAGWVASVALAIALISAASAMTFVGPRVYAAMARDGLLPRSLVGDSDRPPVRSTLLQGAVALLILYTHRLQEILQNVGAVLTLFSALTALCLFSVLFRRPDLPRPRAIALVAAGVYVASACFMLYTGIQRSSSFWAWAATFFALAGLAYATTTRLRKAPLPHRNDGRG